MSNGTFSKIFGPGMRLGWMEVPARVRFSILSTGVSISGGGFNHCISGIMESVISLGLLTQMLQESRPLYQVGCAEGKACSLSQLFLLELKFSMHDIVLLEGREPIIIMNLFSLSTYIPRSTVRLYVMFLELSCQLQCFQNRRVAISSG